nr:MAG TPA: hypothetical protein [Caudoviricetes sp.]
MNNKRSGKFYRKNEAEVMRSLGLEPTPNSGSGWIVKEDGQSEDVICQLKSTDAMSIKINLKDIETLEYNALVAHKLPVFAIQFLCNNQTYLLVKPEDLQDVSGLIVGNKPDNSRYETLGIENTGLGGPSNGVKEKSKGNRKIIKSSKSSRESFNREHEKKFQKKSKSAL